MSHPEKRKARNRRLLVDYGITIFTAVAIALAIRFYLVEAYRIPSAAMRPALLPGDTIFVSKWEYSTGQRKTPSRGEVVVYSPRWDARLNYIKRVLALPGDTIQVKAGEVSLNGLPLRVSPQDDGAGGDCSRESLPQGSSFLACRDKPALEDFGPEKVPLDHVFVLGDLRAQGKGETRKNRSWGFIPMTSIKGRAMWIWLSVQPREISEARTSWPKIRWDRMFRRVE